MTAVEYTTVRDIEILGAGMAWRGMTGVYYVTAEHLADMVAAQDDPLIRAARVKLGHIDPRFNAGLSSHDPWNLDAQPAFGSLVNYRLVEGGAKLIADAEQVPAWLAAAMPSAYPSRSAEWIWDYTTAGDRAYTAVLTDVALLGVERPAGEDLADLTEENIRDLLEQGPDALALAAAPRLKEGITVPDAPSASVSADRVASVFDDLAWSEDLAEGFNTYWWWCRDVRVDPDEVIASDGEGGTFRIPFQTDGEHEVTFGDPVEVRQTYVDVAAPSAAASAAQARHGQQVLVANRPRPERPDPDNPAATRSPIPTPDEEENQMSIDIPALRERLELSETDLPDDATEDQINAALTAEPAEEAGNEGGADEPETHPEGAREPDLAAATATVDRDALTQLQADAAAGREARAQQLATERGALIDQAIRDGKFPPSAAQSYRAQLDRGGDVEASTRQFIDELTPGVVPVDDEQGASASDPASTDAEHDKFMSAHFPQAARRRSARERQEV